MRSPTTQTRPSMSYAPETMLRAERAMRCSPFNFRLFEQMQSDSVALQAIAGSEGVQQAYTRKPLAELSAESELVWLIQVGLLRREVDGQGLTDRFRLTPLGQILVQQWQNRSVSANHSFQDEWLALNWKDYASNFLSRWLPMRFL